MIRFLIIGCLLCGALLGTPAVRESDVIVDSAHWPPRAALREDFRDAAGAVVVAAGSEGVVLRADPTAETVLLDLGRAGRKTVPLRATDFRARAERVRMNPTTKERPNYVAMLGSRLVAHRAGGAVPVQREAGFFEGKRGFLFMYVSSETAALDAWASGWTSCASAVAEAGIVPVLVPQPVLADAELDQCLRERAVEGVTSFFGFMTEAYARTLEHLEEGAEGWVWTDLDGKILARGERLEALAKRLGTEP